MSAGRRRITGAEAAALQHAQDKVVHKRPQSSCICHPRSINPPYRLTPRARTNLIWPLHACRSSRMKKLDFIAVDLRPAHSHSLFCCLQRPSPVIPSQTSAAPIGYRLMRTHPFLSGSSLVVVHSLSTRSPATLSAQAHGPPIPAEQLQAMPFFRGRVPTLWFGRQSTRTHAAQICVPCEQALC
jgi:hypothetical protein